MRLIVALLALTLSLPSLASAAGSAGAVAPTQATMKKAILAGLDRYQPAPTRTLNSKKFAKFMSSAVNYDKIILIGSRPGGPELHGGVTAWVGKKLYPNKIFVRGSFMGKSDWKMGDKPKF